MHDRALAALLPVGAGDGDLDRDARLPARGRVRPLPDRVGAREPARVPGLARSAASSSRSRCFPDWVRPISWVLAPTWGMQAIRESAQRRDAAARPARVRRARRCLHDDRRARRRPRAAGRARTRATLLADVTLAAGIFFVGGLTSYRALFGWLSPWILIPTYVVAPIFQILLFVYIGRRRRELESDEFYVDRQRAPVRGDPVHLRDDEHDRGRAVPEHARLRPRHAGAGGSRSSSAGRCR